MKLALVPASRSNGQPLKLPTTVASRSRVMSGVSVFCWPSWSLTADYLIQVCTIECLWSKQTHDSFLPTFRYDKRRSPESGWARLSHANAAQLQPCSLRDYAWVLAQGSNASSDVRDPPMEARGLLHHGPKRLQRSTSALIAKWRRHFRHCKGHKWEEQ